MMVNVFPLNRKVNAKKQMVMLKVVKIILTKTIVFAKDRMINDKESRRILLNSNEI